MRILQLTNKSPWPPKDGGAIASMNLTKGFGFLGHKVTILSMNTEKHKAKKKDIPENLKALADFHFVDVPASISVWGAIRNLLFSRLPYNAERFISEDFSLALIKLLQKKKYDIIQLEGLYLCPYIALIRRHSDAKIVYRAHNIEHEIWNRTAKMTQGPKKNYLKLLAARIKRFEISYLNDYDLLVPITERDAAMLNSMGNKKPYFTSQTGIDLSFLIPTAKNLEFPSLFHIGSLDWSPNQEGLIWFLNNCWPVISKKYTELKFYIAGRNAPLWLEKKFSLKNIVYLGEIEDAYEFINSKAIMVVPLFSGSGMRIKIVEGMALGKPIVTTSIGTEGIETTSGEDILIADDAESFNNAIYTLLENREVFDKIGKNAIDLIRKKFDNLALAAQLIEFYNNHL
ncbi:MAG: hypothetical protein A2W90_13250 [Bacteroidetes bacterium GWF2_42_66]|nr:MAG: hypothetical protein A2W92_19240 [Bacteroidetes bacterium GWA2_42_15]OFY00184.1 MAG: hypothetical protein A2W89_18240 [Bacteroidetes bacterium GWE2_42_39]OFY40325.1 MAG: hypothetical protein A2W90_13250 [Bacteroidetes bacterium GWF2_42_66]HBL73689.1 glycosyl transferase family 4 [Prolixibacteraceae bacterium]HCR90699.1 glycosyl transferase family 4 [Prolixibacteraceae bacterium]